MDIAELKETIEEAITKGLEAIMEDVKDNNMHEALYASGKVDGLKELLAILNDPEFKN